MVSEDTEITLGLGRLLGLFFLLVAICGVFLSIGYSLGKSNAREQALNDEPSQVMAATPSAAASSEPSADKPSAAVGPKSGAAQQPAQEQPTASNEQKPLTFYKAVQQNGANTPTPANGSAPAAPAASETAAAASTESETPPKEATSHSASLPGGRSTPMTGPGTIVVQIAALSREDDAVALAGALRKKDYSVMVVKNPATNDRFYHVQVGPFTTMQDADAMKSRLVAEGYNPIVKK